MSSSATRCIRRVAGLGALATVAAFGHVFYPLWLAWRSRGTPDPVAPSPGPQGWPGITVVVPAYLEATLIEAKVDDLRGNGYPGDLEVLVVADDPETAEAARATGVRVVASERRLGKAEALNRGIAAARHPVVVLTDANTRLNAGALATMVRWMSDPTVVGVAGEKRVGGEREGQGWFWRFESWLKRRETLTGTTVGLVGELAAVRRSWVLSLPADLAVDDLWLALDLIERGGRVVYEPGAVANEEPSRSLADEWERRTRVVAGTLDVLWRRRRLLRPGTGMVAAQLWGHRLVRSSFGPVAHLVLFFVALARLRRSRLAMTFTIGHVAAAAALARSAVGGHSSSVERLLAQVLFLQLIGLGGTLRYLRMDRPALWPKSPR